MTYPGESCDKAFKLVVHNIEKNDREYRIAAKMASHWVGRFGYAPIKIEIDRLNRELILDYHHEGSALIVGFGVDNSHLVVGVTAAGLPVPFMTWADFDDILKHLGLPKKPTKPIPLPTSAVAMDQPKYRNLVRDLRDRGFSDCTWSLDGDLVAVQGCFISAEDAADILNKCVSKHQSALDFPATVIAARYSVHDANELLNSNLWGPG